MATVGPGAQLNEALTLVRMLGEGGMGAVWLAEHRTLKTQVAVKVMHPELGRRDPTAAQRFAAEAQAAAKVRHPHIVQMLDHGTTADGVAWLSMELLEGRSLRDVLENEGRVAPGYACEIVVQTASALAKAHAAGIVHRDLKPENLFVTDVGGRPYVKVLDFGIAKVAGEAGARTATGAVFGTPAYMSLEQLKSTKHVDAQADLWALAVVAYELVTGRLPFDGDTASAIVLAVAAGDYRPASALVSGLGERGDAFFARAFAKEPSSRYASADELATSFVAAVEGASGVVSGANSSWQPRPASSSGEPAQRGTQVGGDGVPSAPSASIPSIPSGHERGVARRQPASGARRRAVLAVAAVGVLGLVMAAAVVSTRSRSGTAHGSSATPRSGDAQAAEGAGRGASGASGRGQVPRCRPNMVGVPAGAFTVGESRASATVADFCLDRTEVTTAAFRDCVKAGKCRPAGTGEGCNAGVPGRDEHPINCVDWAQADGFCKAQGLRLPTEVEWEYAARGTDSREFPWGDGAPGDQLCWNGEGNDLGKGKRSSTCPVGVHPKGDSPFGAADTAGNVLEWTATEEGPNRVARGAAWSSAHPSFVRASLRSKNTPTLKRDFLGFRCAGPPLP